MNPFTAQRVGHTHTIQLNGIPAQIFPLFTPEEEKKWAEGWDFLPIYPPTREAEENMIFTTASHDHGQMDAIWIITRFDPEAFFIEYQRIELGIKIGRIRIQCRGEGNTTLAAIEYVYTALSEQGNRFLEGFSESFYQEFIQSWEKAIHHYWHTGKALGHH